MNDESKLQTGNLTIDVSGDIWVADNSQHSRIINPTTSMSIDLDKLSPGSELTYRDDNGVSRSITVDLLIWALKNTETGNAISEYLDRALKSLNE